MNEDQRLGKRTNTDEDVTQDLKSSSSTKDYSQYFDFSKAKIETKDDGSKALRINGRDILIKEQPDYKEGKRRGKEETKILSYEIPQEMKTIGKGKTFLVRTYGCQMNYHDTENMAGILLEMGFSETDDTNTADIILLNTCAIRENAENKVFGEIGNLKPLKIERPELIIGVCGCMSQEEAVVNRIMQKHQHIDLIFGTHNIHRLPHLLQEAIFGKEMVIEVWSKEGDIVENLPRARQGNTQAWVNIMYGCDKFCTYCIVPYTRGKERSRLPEDVIAEVRDLARQGYKEITLLGQNVNAYGKDLDQNYGLGDLMDELRTIDIPRIRFTTSHPRDFDDKLIEVLAKGGNMVEHIHLPVQHGNSEILKLMARKYTREQYIELATKIKTAIPNASFTTDIIVGFPNETEEQFEETLSLVKEIEFDSAYTYIYSPREGTPAAKMEDNVPLEVKKARLARLNALVNEISAKKNIEYQDKVVEVLVEGESKKNPDVLSGRTRTNRLVNFKAPKSVIGEIVYIKITDAKTWSLNGELVEVAEVK
ncbi:tRNA (N6-isopentenyl adenosine(37)-C2)-methylthiotransferase MiaB [Alkalihalobacillus sp. LMS39]|uniref:tRNA (N6-isopentenyl adenosine(37)-C2)-methylthiotransferase MiaB n=1 Tax=Alkalihalobacillus sp. LMS39 TaxID=2924032 RepID=UPI001FB3CE68|nr:tRNA (N6-isopentenyl adenosine(37)-C2)-methylthiotransferase MiaB [Alkalihalobacillus sp. LMS39]UOE92770.1 tRNA (N6-isopentenyl adenosine(37)-C2)-methylthiotransferase MiaB [Alkalihalobacillus sp. LMS39]